MTHPLSAELRNLASETNFANSSDWAFDRQVELANACSRSADALDQVSDERDELKAKLKFFGENAPDLNSAWQELKRRTVRAEKAEAERDLANRWAAQIVRAENLERERGEYRNSFHDKIIECDALKARVLKLEQILAYIYGLIETENL